MNFKLFKIILIVATLLTCSTISYSRNSEYDEENDHCTEQEQEEENECYLNGEEIDCRYCMQDGGCSRFSTNSTRYKIYLKINKIIKKIIFWAGS